jgi:hypothetical protein
VSSSSGRVFSKKRSKFTGAHVNRIVFLNKNRNTIVFKWTKNDTPFSKNECQIKNQSNHQSNRQKHARLRNHWTTTRQRCNSTIFIVHKDKDKVRPVTNYAHLRNIIVKPKSYLPSLFQIIEKREWKPTFLHRIRFQASIYNIQLSNRTNTTFEYDNKYYKYKRLPFGNQPAPYFAQTSMRS